MGDHVTRERTITTRTVDGVTVDVVELQWKYGGVGYDVYTHNGDNSECISDESFDYIPNDDEIHDLLTARNEDAAARSATAYLQDTMAEAGLDDFTAARAIRFGLAALTDGVDGALRSFSEPDEVRDELSRAAIRLYGR